MGKKHIKKPWFGRTKIVEFKEYMKSPKKHTYVCGLFFICLGKFIKARFGPDYMSIITHQLVPFFMLTYTFHGYS